MPRRATVAIVHYEFGHPLDVRAGGEAVMVHALDALQHDHDVHLFTNLIGADDPPRLFERANTFFATSVDAHTVTVHADAPVPSTPGGVRKIKGLARFVRRQATHARLRDQTLTPDVWISTRNNLAIEGHDAVLQYVHLPDELPGFSRMVDELLHLRYRAGMRSTRRNPTLTNSLWTARRCERLGYEDVRVVYPPVHASNLRPAWEERRPDLVVVGRVHPEKRVEWAIDAVAMLRQHGLVEQLHVVGPKTNQAYERSLLAHIESKGLRDAVTLHGALPRSELDLLLAQSRYGIHTMHDEHFGIAPAEMLRAGMIPFVHASGGQVEIVRHDPRLLFHTIDEAAVKIAEVASDEANAFAVLADLEPLRDRFSSSRFASELRSIVAEKLHR